MMNKHHPQLKSIYEFIWGDQIMIHSSMSIDIVNFQFSKIVGNVISRWIEPFNKTEVLQTLTESFILFRIISRIPKLLRSKILN
jgi:hypothetical protein